MLPHFLILISLLMARVKEIEASHELYAHLLENYNKELRPVTDSKSHVLVQIEPVLISVVEVDDRRGIVKFVQWLRMFWKDENLTWNPKDFNGTETIKLPLKKLWHPDITVYNSIPETTMSPDLIKVTVTSEGRASLSVPFMISVRCVSFNLEQFPFDTQHCSIQYSSWSYDLNELKLVPKETDFDRELFEHNSEWKVLSFDSKTRTANYSTFGKHVEVLYDLVIKRRPKYYLYTLVVPTFIITICCILALFVPSSSTNERVERNSIGLTTLLTLAVMLNIVANEMPKSPELSLIGNYMVTQIVLVLVETVVAAVVMQFHRRALGQGWEVPMWLFSTLCKHGSVTENQMVDQTVRAFLRYLQNEQINKEKELAWARLFNRLDFVLLLVFLVADVVYTFWLLSNFDTFSALQNLDQKWLGGGKDNSTGLF